MGRAGCARRNDTQAPVTYRSVALGSVLLPLVLALLGLAGWLSGSLRLASVRTQYIPMAPSTAIGFLLVSAAVIGIALEAGVAVRNAVRVVAALLSVLAIVKLLEFFTGTAALNLEATLVARPADFGTVPLARMSPLTAVAFLATGLTLVVLTGFPARASRDTGGVLGGLVALEGTTVVLGYVFGAPLLYGGRIIPMALTTGVAFMGTGVAMVALAGPTATPLRAFCGDSARARLLRVFLPLTVFAVLFNGILTHVILERVRANPALLAAVFALVSAAAVGVAISWMARSLGTAIDHAELVMNQSRDALEQRVRERTADLSAVNRELESFSYSVSHDLRAPLRHVTGFTALLQKDAAAQLDEPNQRRLTQVSDAAQRMSQLIDDLLELSRTARAALQKRPTSLTALVREAQAEITVQAAGRQILWHVQDSLPEIDVDPGLFRLVLINLFSNAVKYTSPRPVAEIEFGTTAGTDEETVLFVRDNGVGFDVQYAHKLFGVFQRLHRAEEFEGTGVGLANVSRIVQRHGGRAWAESELGRGATFYVALPAATRGR